MSVDIDPLTAEWIAGAVFIALYAYKRYNTSRFTGIAQNRGSTTFLRFSGFFLCYLLTLLTIYWLFGSLLQTSPEIFARLSPLFGGAGTLVSPGPSGGDLAHLTGPIVSALMLTMLLPTLPLLKSFDDWLVQKFWGLGQIPHYVLRQSKKLRRAPLTIRPGRRNEIIAEADKFRIPHERLVFEKTAGIEHHWMRLCHLMVELRAWNERSGKYARFLQDNQQEFDALKFDFDNVSMRLSNFEDQNASVPAESRGKSSGILEDLKEQLKQSMKDHYKRVCTFIACGVFAAELTGRARRKSLKDMGFDQDAVLVESLTPSQVVTLALSIAAAFVGISVVEDYLKHPESIRLGPILFLSLIMTMSYGAAAIAAIIPKATWSFADIDQSGRRFFPAYLLAALLAVFFGLIAMISIRYTYNAVGGLDPEQNIDKVLIDLSWSHPYLVQSAAIGFATSFSVDSFHSRSGVWRGWFRWADSVGLGLIMLAATVVTYCWIEGVGPFEATRDLAFRGKTNPFLFVAKGTVVGLVIGYLVPHWYRQNQRRTPMQRLTQLLNRQGSDVAYQAGQLDPGLLLDAMSTVAAYVASADGTVDSIEQDVLREFIYKLQTVEAVDFTVGDATRRFKDRAKEFESAEQLDVSAALAPLRPMVGRRLLPEILVYLGLATGHADGFFAKEERDAIDSIIAVLKLDSENFDLSAK